MLLHPFLKTRCKNKAELFDFLILNSVRPENEGVKEEIAKMSSKQKRNLCNGIYSISRIAEKIYPYLDMSDLNEALKEEIKGYAIDDCVNSFILCKRQFHHPKPTKMPVRFHQTVIPGRLF